MEIPLKGNHDLFDYEQLPEYGGGFQYPVERIDFTLLRGTFYLVLTELSRKWDVNISHGTVYPIHESIVEFTRGLMQ